MFKNLKNTLIQSSLLLTVMLLMSLSKSWADDISYSSSRLKQKLEAAWQAKGKDYQARSQLLLSDGRPAYINRLILEDSPYLVQHAHNPVNWFPWGDEAFSKAKQENKPVFISIGYSTCHWCHVMEQESFDNPEIAAILNKHFISIKVDRERRPDVDAVYMTAVQMITGNGGWPMSSFTTPDGKTFLGGTYFPPKKFKEILIKVNDLWLHQQALILAQADKVALAVARNNQNNEQAKAIDQQLIRSTLNNLLQVQDSKYGGFVGHQKFPNEPWLLYLLEFALRDGDPAVLAAVESSLQAMSNGGIHDQIGGGFHRYATDQKWRVPHFEKMLYNQALLARVYLYGYQLTSNSAYARIARQTLDYVLQDMTASSGGFYSASDADSEGVEGTYFLWTVDQIKQILKSSLATRAINLFGITEQGNFEGKNILYLPEDIITYAQKHKLDLTELYSEIDQIRKSLKKARQKRVAPFRDDKILTSWNAMMISTLAIAADVLQQPEYLEAAERAALFLWTHSRVNDTDFWRVNLEGISSISANQEDYAYLAEALIQLYDSSGKSVWLQRAQSVSNTMVEKFWDNERGGFFLNIKETAGMIMVRPKIIQDNPLPSHNGVSVRVLAKLSRRTRNPKFAERAASTLAAFSAKIIRTPMTHTTMLLAANELHYGESGSRQYAARGAVLISATSKTEEQEFWLTIKIKIEPNWHINAHQPLQDYLIPTSVSLAGDGDGWQMGQVAYPQPLTKALGFQKGILALYEGNILLRAKLLKTGKSNRPIPIKIKLQACDDKICLPPEKITLQVPFKAG